jgi:predicted nucleic acid-binding protein
VIFLDSSVWIAAFSENHIHHAASRPMLKMLRPETAACGTHSLAEVYSVLTRMPGESRAHPRAAMDFVASMVRHTTMVALEGREYLEVIDATSKRGLSGSIVYDALLLECARRAKAKRIYTWNVRHFRTIAPDLAAKIVTPGE